MLRGLQAFCFPPPGRTLWVRLPFETLRTAEGACEAVNDSLNPVQLVCSCPTCAFMSDLFSPTVPAPGLRIFAFEIKGFGKPRCATQQNKTIWGEKKERKTMTLPLRIDAT